MIIEALHQVANHRHSLTREVAREVMSEILSGGATDAQIAALLVALHMKGETVEEIVGFAEAMRKASAPLKVHDSALDVSGTRSEEHTSELQSPVHLVCRLLLEKKKQKQQNKHNKKPNKHH